MLVTVFVISTPTVGSEIINAGGGLAVFYAVTQEPG
jgi:hypothetical protein